jgi:hypothetical protein
MRVNEMETPGHLGNVKARRRSGEGRRRRLQLSMEDWRRRKGRRKKQMIITKLLAWSVIPHR